jgi:predicted Rossmann-fold nucleotide-binding protein
VVASERPTAQVPDRARRIPHALVVPETVLSVLSQAEVNDLCRVRAGRTYALFRRCALATLTTGSEVDDARALLEAYPDFEITFEQVDRGIRLHLYNAPARAFVDGVMIRGIQEHLFAVLRDITYLSREIGHDGHFDLESPAGVTDAVFRILRHAGLFRRSQANSVVVCWGGHAIQREEYDYCKEVGYQLGLRGLDICTGCGPGAMKGPMKGATIAHAKQRIGNGRYIGITEPGIIAAEAPNPIVNDLVIMPDIEKRLEAFARIAHGIVIFPGGVGTLEELLYLLGVFAHPANASVSLPVILSGPASSASYFAELDRFVRAVLGPAFATRYQIIIDAPEKVASRMRKATDAVLRFRDEHDDAPYFNWLLQIESVLQEPFVPTHTSMAELRLSRAQTPYELASNLRRAFSGLVCGNVKEEGIRAVEAHGPFELHADPLIVDELDRLLRGFIAQGRMRLGGRDYVPCYRIVS